MAGLTALGRTDDALEYGSCETSAARSWTGSGEARR
jgi:hypothetical protein